MALLFFSPFRQRQALQRFLECFRLDQQALAAGVRVARAIFSEDPSEWRHAKLMEHANAELLVPSAEVLFDGTIECQHWYRQPTAYAAALLACSREENVNLVTDALRLVGVTVTPQSNLNFEPYEVELLHRCERHLSCAPVTIRPADWRPNYVMTFLSKHQLPTALPPPLKAFLFHDQPLMPDDNEQVPIRFYETERGPWASSNCPVAAPRSPATIVLQIASLPSPEAVGAVVAATEFVVTRLRFECYAVDEPGASREQQVLRRTNYHTLDSAALVVAHLTPRLQTAFQLVSPVQTLAIQQTELAKASSEEEAPQDLCLIVRPGQLANPKAPSKLAPKDACFIIRPLVTGLAINHPKEAEYARCLVQDGPAAANKWWAKHDAQFAKQLQVAADPLERLLFEIQLAEGELPAPVAPPAVVSREWPRTYLQLYASDHGAPQRQWLDRWLLEQYRAFAVTGLPIPYPQ